MITCIQINQIYRIYIFFKKKSLILFNIRDNKLKITKKKHRYEF